MRVASRTRLAAHSEPVRGTVWRRKAVAPALVGVTVLALAASDGGYFATAWGWSAVLLCWVVGIGVIVGVPPTLTRLQWTMLGGLALLATWSAASALWSIAPAESVLDAERGLLYTAAAAAFVLLVQPGAGASVLSSLALAVTLTDGYALATRLFPDRLGVYDNAVAHGRLYQPVGYWNALAAVSAIGIVLLLGHVAHARVTWVRALSAASLLVVVPTLYFTYSRGALMAGLGGLAVAVALDPRRRRFAAALLATAPWAALGTAAAWSSDALNASTTDVGQAAADGRRLVVVLLLCAAAAAACVAAPPRAVRRVAPSARGRRLLAIGVATATLALAAGVVGSHGGPVAVVKRAGDALRAPSPGTPRRDALSDRLSSLSLNGRLTLWSAAWDDIVAHPLAGSGAGSFGRYWVGHAPDSQFVRDAHDLYLEAFAEVGLVGVALLTAALAAPLAAAMRRRVTPVIAVAAGGYTVFLLHAAVDWDWEVPAVTVTALACAAVMLAPDVRRPAGRWMRALLGAGAVGCAALAMLGFVSNNALSKASEATHARAFAEAQSHARTAIRWAPWSAAGWIALGDAYAKEGDRRRAADAYAHATSTDAGSWQAWYDLSTVTAGKERRRALDRVRALFPHNPDIVAAGRDPAPSLRPTRRVGAPDRP
jgi:hypothetical protein